MLLYTFTTKALEQEMAKNQSESLGKQPIGKLLMGQSIPAAIGILVMSLNMIVDTIFVGNGIGPLAIAAITIVIPITFLISSVGMAIGIGGSSIISRAIGANDHDKAHRTFGNQIAMSLGLALILLVLGLTFKDEALLLFGAKGDILPQAETYFTIVMYGVPFLALAMTGTPVIRAEGKARFAMVAMIIPAVSNVILDYFFIIQNEWGMAGAAWATTASYFMAFVFDLWFFTSKQSELQIKLKCLFVLEMPIVKEISSLGIVTLARQGVISLLSIILNHTLFIYGGELSIAVYGIISRMLMFALFPVLGVTQGFMPIAGFNYGAEKFERVKETVKKSMIYASALALIIFVVIMAFPDEIVNVFTDNGEIMREAPPALRIVFAMTPLIAIQLIGSAYFQAIGKAVPALLLTLTKQGFFLIPLILILPNYFDLVGVWISFPIADLLSMIVTAVFLGRDLNKLEPVVVAE